MLCKLTKALDWYTISPHLPPKQNIPSIGNNKKSQYKIVRRWSSTSRKNVAPVELAVKECAGHNVGLGWTLKAKQEKLSMDWRQERGTWKRKCTALQSSTGHAARLDYTFQQKVTFPSASTRGIICTHPLVWNPV